jgi:hypothetical protein
MIPGSAGITLQAGTLYEFEFQGHFTIGNATSKNMTFTLSGPSGTTITFFSYSHIFAYNIVAVNTFGSSTHGFFTTQTASFSAVTATTLGISWKGQFRVNASGKFLPMITFSVAPTSYSLAAGSSIKVTPIKTAADGTTALSTGAW